jgi:hypothetical protein
VERYASRFEVLRTAIFSLLTAGCMTVWPAHASAAPGDAVTPGELVVEHPTLINLGFE